MVYPAISIANGLSIFLCFQKEWQTLTMSELLVLNDWMVKNSYSLLLILEIMDKLKGAKYFTKLDVHWGYNNVWIRKEDGWKAAFKTNKGLFEPTVMFFGMCNAPATFQAMIDNIFMMIIDNQPVIVYMDNILIFADTKEELEQITKLVLEKLREHDLFLKAKK
jgi:Reverse transcriptase (RNA-dependent DNA polymerase)